MARGVLSRRLPVARAAMLRAASPSHPHPSCVDRRLGSAPPRPQAGGERKKIVKTRGATASIAPGGRGFVCIKPDCDEASLALRPLASSLRLTPFAASSPRRLCARPSPSTTAPLPPRLQFRDTAEGIFEHIERAHPKLEPRREVRSGNEARRA